MDLVALLLLLTGQPSSDGLGSGAGSVHTDSGGIPTSPPPPPPQPFPSLPPPNPR